MALDFTSAQDDEAEAPAELEFRLDKKPFKCTLRTDGDSVLEWSEMAAGATEEDFNSPAGAAFISRFFKLMMEPAEYRAFRAHMRAYNTNPDTLAEICEAINDEFEKVIEARAERPTPQPSRSSRGRAGRGERTAKIISLSEADGDIEVVSDKPARRSPARRATPARRTPARKRTG